ncbi:RNA methyltransferase [Nitriliruptoraceae bacterium ZYF776]|nr:RNA methyltransferase [Profundirhabdus halotolerans]
MTDRLRVTARDATFQRWTTLLTNRTKRRRAGELLVQGVRPLDQAVAHGWQVRTWLHGPDGVVSRWAHDHLDASDAPRAAVATDLLAELGGKEEQVPELLAVVAIPPDDLTRIPPRPDALVVVFDRPSSPGNLGTLLRSADAFGADGVVVTGHAADPYDPRCVRASTGSLFATPTVRVGSHREVLAWVETTVRAAAVPLQVVGTDERGELDLPAVDLTAPTLVVVGNETNGMSAGWRAACERTVRIPMTGSASSLNAATAGSLVLYEAARQRGTGVAAVS